MGPRELRKSSDEIWREGGELIIISANDRGRVDCPDLMGAPIKKTPYQNG
jgi:hypothetical protein